MYVQRNVQTRSRNHWFRGKTISITYFECLSVGSVIQHEKHMRRIILSSVTCTSLPCISTLYHKFSKSKVIVHKLCVLTLSTAFV